MICTAVVMGLAVVVSGLGALCVTPIILSLAVMMVGPLVVCLGVVRATTGVRKMWKDSCTTPPSKLLPPISMELYRPLDSMVEAFVGAIRCVTVFQDDPWDNDWSQWDALHTHLTKSFPLVHRHLTREIVNGYALLFIWEGRDPSLDPVILTAHQDVVPVEPGTEGLWDAPAFEGKVMDEFLVGRGTLDDKVGLMGILEAVEWHLSQGHMKPHRTVYLAFGHDEEKKGEQGAGALVTALMDRGIKAACVVDEGMCIISGLIPGVNVPVAPVGVGEKGHTTFTLHVHCEGGHASMPPPETSIGILAKALCKVESHPMPCTSVRFVRMLFEPILPYLSPGLRFFFATKWLADTIMRFVLQGLPSVNALLRTTTALTVVHAGEAENALTADARAKVDARILPGETSAQVRKHLERVIADPRVCVEAIDTNDPHPIAPLSGEWIDRVNRSISEVFPGVLVTKSLVVGMTDGRFYNQITPNVFRFAPIRLGKDDLKRIHGTNERISLANYEEAVKFYYRLVHNLADMDNPST